MFAKRKNDVQDVVHFVQPTVSGGLSVCADVQWYVQDCQQGPGGAGRVYSAGNFGGGGVLSFFLPRTSAENGIF